MSEIQRAPQERDDEQRLATLLDEHAVVIDQVQLLADEVLSSNQIAALSWEQREESQELKDQTVRRSELWSEFLAHATNVHSRLGTTLPAEPRASAIKGLIAELTRRRRDLDQQILTIVDRHFRDAIRPRLIKQFGSGVASRQQDAFVRYTQMVNRFFEKVLEQRHDDFWRANSVAKLRNWASEVMTNDMIDQLRRRKLGQGILDELGELACSRKVHFEKSCDGVSFEAALEQIERWEATGTAREQRIAKVLRRRYVDGDEPDAIALALGTNVKRVSEWKLAGLAMLQQRLNP